MRPYPLAAYRGEMMAVRIRADGQTIICAARSAALPGDTYLDDVIHETLGRCRANSLGVLVENGIDENGADLWKFVCSEHGRLRVR